MPEARGVERAWRGEDAGARLARLALAPLSLLYGVAIRARNAGFDRGVLASHAGPIPAVSVGNLSVGGTGKTPVSAWIARLLAERGAHPAIVLRGYGDDEPQVHEALNPDVPVVVSPDRVAGVAHAAEAGATVAVLDDAFQHRRARRDVDVVLVSADAWREPVRLLPAGPWREPLQALARASIAVVTRKAVGAAAARRVADRLCAAAPRVPVAIVHLAPGELRSAGGASTRPLADVRGARVLAIAGIGDPGAFAAQLRAAGADVALRAFADHHAFTEGEARALADEGAEMDLVVCTLKDAVKLAAVWPADRSPLWYVSQRVVAEAGEEALRRLLDDVVLPTIPRARTAGPDRPQSPTHGH